MFVNQNGIGDNKEVIPGRGNSSIQGTLVAQRWSLGLGQRCPVRDEADWETRVQVLINLEGHSVGFALYHLIL